MIEKPVGAVKRWQANLGEFDMTTPLSRADDRRDEDSTAKAVWTRPTLEVAEIGSSTQAGGGLVGDLDSNDVS